MKLSENGANEIKKFEGLRLKSYKCSGGVATIGYGHTANVRIGQQISKTQADEYFKNDISKYEKEVNEINKRKNYNLNQNQFDSLVSFGFNCGIGGLRTLTNNRTKSQLTDGMKLYNKAGKKINNGLVNRRKRECDLFNKPIGNNTFNSYTNNYSNNINTNNTHYSPFIDRTNYYTGNLNRINANPMIRNNSVNYSRGGANVLPRRGGATSGVSCIIF